MKINSELVLISVLLLLSLFLDGPAVTIADGLNGGPLDGLFSWITSLGSVIVVLIFMTSLFLWQEKKKKWIVILWLSFFVAAVASQIIKLIVNRPRMVDSGLLAGSSFPSSHAAIAFAAMAVLDKEFPKFKWFWIGFAAMVGLSRVYFHYHYLSDVFAGALLGYIIGHYLVLKKRRIIKWIWSLKSGGK